jgi:4-amino-4-deoxy-L-arabinose transferase-like glycosyltransferase
MLLFLVAERLTPAAPELEDRRPATPPPRGFWTLFAVGCALCVAAGVLVYRRAWPSITHPPWFLGLLLLSGSAWWSRWRAWSWPHPPAKVLAAVLLLLMLASALFAWRLTTVPVEVHGDEGEEGMDAVALMHDEPLNLFTVGWYWLPRFHVVRQAAGMKLFGVNLLGLRSTSVVIGALSVLLVLSVGYRLWSFEVGLLAALVLVSARFFIHLSRTGLEYIDTPFLSILVVWLSVRAWRELRLGAAIMCGIALGLGIQSYYASRLVPLLLTFTWLAWLQGSDRRLARARAGRFVVIVLAALATAAPMIGYFWNHRTDLWMRTLDTSVFSQSSLDHLSYGYGTRDLRYILLVQLQHALTLFNATPDSSLQYGLRPGGLFEPVSAALFVLGLGLLGARPFRQRNLLLLLWIVVPVIVGGVLTIDTPFYPRIGSVVPFAVLVVALALHSLLDSLRRALPRSVARVLVALVAAGVLTAVFANNIRSYFFEYAPHHRHGPGVEISAWIRAHGAGKTTYMVGGKNYWIRHGAIRFLTYGYETMDVIDLDAYLHSNRFDRATSLFIIMPQGKELMPKLTAVVGPLDVQAHRNAAGQTAFFTAEPIVARPNGEPAKGFTGAGWPRNSAPTIRASG